MSSQCITWSDMRLPQEDLRGKYTSLSSPAHSDFHMETQGLLMAP